MGGIYSTPEKSNSNIRQNNVNSLINFPVDSTQINNGVYPSAFHHSSIGTINRSSHSELNNSINGNFTRNLNPDISSTHSSFLQNPRTCDKGNEDLLNYQYMSDGSPFQLRNISISPKSVLSNQYKHQNFNPNQILLNNTLQQSRQVNVLSQLNATKTDPLQNNQMHQSCSKLSSDFTNRVNSTNYPMSAQNINQSGLFQANKRLQMLSQPPNKRPRLSHDFTNMTQQNSSNINQGSHFLNLANSDTKKLSSSPQKHIQNVSIYKGNIPSNGTVWSNKEPSYHPQVEAISPCPDDMRLCDLKNITEKDDIGEKLRDVEDEILKQQEHVNRLREKTELLNNKINQPNIDYYIKEEDSFVPLSRDPIQLIIANNQRKATEQHQLFQRFCGDHVSWNALALPIYKQPSDIELLMNVKNHFHKTFKPMLIKHIRLRKMAERARLKLLSQNYEVSVKAWYKRLDKYENSVKRRQKEMKYRELFEKVFPEIKRNREDKEKDATEIVEGINFNYESNGTVSNSLANTRSVSHCNGVNMTDQQRSHSPYDSIKENEKMKEYAIDPPIYLPSWNKNYGLIECARLIKDPKHKHVNFQNFKTNWLREEIEIFKEQYINTPKNFGRIASFLQKKSVSDCIQYYYLTKKTANYKTLVKKNARRRRVQAERQQRFRSETEQQNINTIQQSTSELIIDTSSQTVENTKFNPILPHNFIEIETSNHSKEPLGSEHQQNIFNSEMNTSVQESVKYCMENKNSIQSTDQEKKNACQYQTSKHIKDHSDRCSDRISVYRNPRDSDSDENDEVHRSQLPSECLINMLNSSHFNKNSITESDFKSEKDKQSDKCSDSYFTNTQNQSSQISCKFESKTTKPEYIHIKDAIDYSIEQSLSQSSENKKVKLQNTDKNNYINDQFSDKKKFDNHSMFQNNNETNPKSNINENFGFNYPFLASRESSAFQEVKKEFNVNDTDKSIKLTSNFNRKILMKDFCTAQMINPGPANNSLNSKSGSSPFQRNPSISSNFVDLFMNNSDTVNKNMNAMSKKSDFFIDRVSKLYEEEVEPYTDEFRNRSDSQRTRTSSEASQMYAYIKDRSLKIENQSKGGGTQTMKSSEDKNINNNTADSRLKMPPPDVTDQKVFRSQKSSFGSKKSPYTRPVMHKDCDIVHSESIKAKLVSDNSFEVVNYEENNEKRKVITAANILNSITEKNAYCNNEVKLVSPTNNTCDNHLLKSNGKLTECLNNQKNHVQKNFHLINLDTTGNIRENSLEKNVSHCSVENKSELSGSIRNYNVPLKKREKPTLLVDCGKLNKSPNSYKRSRIFTNDPSDNQSKYCLEKNNNLILKDNVEVETEDNYDSDSFRFNSPGKLLIDLGNNSEEY